MMRRVVWLLALALLSCSPKEAKQTGAELLVGSWQLERLGDVPVAQSAVREWVITFRPDGTWHYAGWLRGPWQGMHVSGDGTWKLTRNTLQYKTGDAEGAAVVEVSSDALELTPDPVLQKPRVGGPVAATYRRKSR